GDLKRDHFLYVRHHFHGEMRLTVIGASSYRSSHSRRFIWIEEVRVKGHSKSVCTFCYDRERLVHDGANSAAIDLLHRENPHARFFHEFTLLRIDFPDSDLHRVLWLNFWRKPEDVRQFNWA